MKVIPTAYSPPYYTLLLLGITILNIRNININLYLFIE